MRSYGNSMQAPSMRSSYGNSPGEKMAQQSNALDSDAPSPHQWGKLQAAVLLGATSSSKAKNLADEISTMEQRANWLEERNKFLNEKLHHNQRLFAERSVMNTGKAKMTHCFKAWRNGLNELRLENQLEEKSASLLRCQEVVGELGRALEQEREIHMKEGNARYQIEAEYRELANATNMLQANSDKKAAQITSLEKQLTILSEGLDGCRVTGQNFNEECDDSAMMVKKIKAEFTALK